MRQNEEFTPLRVVRKNLTDFDRCAYRVYKSPAEFITVDAATALEAFRESGIQNPLRIVRETRFMERLVDQSKFTDMEELVETGVIMEAPAAITGHQEAVPQATPREPTMPQTAPETPMQEAAPEAFVEQAEPLPQAEEQPAPEPAAAQAAPQVEEDEASELSEDDIHALLGEEGKAQAKAATAGDEGLSPDDVAKLLAQDTKKG